MYAATVGATVTDSVGMSACAVVVSVVELDSVFVTDVVPDSVALVIVVALV